MAALAADPPQPGAGAASPVAPPVRAAGLPEPAPVPEVLAHLRASSDAGAHEFIVRDDANVPVKQALDQLDALS